MKDGVILLETHSGLLQLELIGMLCASLPALRNTDEASGWDGCSMGLGVRLGGGGGSVGLGGGIVLLGNIVPFVLKQRLTVCF